LIRTRFWVGDSSPAAPPEERASGIPRRSDPDRKEDSGSPISSTTGSEEVPAQDLRDAEDDMSVGNLPDHVGTEPFPEFHHPLLMAGGAETKETTPEQLAGLISKIPMGRLGKKGTPDSLGNGGRGRGSWSMSTGGTWSGKISWMLPWISAST